MAGTSRVARPLYTAWILEAANAASSVSSVSSVSSISSVSGCDICIQSHCRAHVACELMNS